MPKDTIKTKFDAVLKRMLGTPPVQHKEMTGTPPAKVAQDDPPILFSRDSSPKKKSKKS